MPKKIDPALRDRAVRLLRSRELHQSAGYDRAGLMRRQSLTFMTWVSEELFILSVPCWWALRCWVSELSSGLGLRAARGLSARPRPSRPPRRSSPDRALRSHVPHPHRRARPRSSIAAPCLPRGMTRLPSIANHSVPTNPGPMDRCSAAGYCWQTRMAFASDPGVDPR